VVVVSHDRAFLDEVVTDVVTFARDKDGDGKLEQTRGDFASYQTRTGERKRYEQKLARAAEKQKKAGDEEDDSDDDDSDEKGLPPIYLPGK
jgi:ATPase subunit of ABC transporter with duplicated ATPase domains